MAFARIVRRKFRSNACGSIRAPGPASNANLTKYEYLRMYELRKKIIYSFLILVLIFLDQSVKYEIRTQGGFYICNKNLAFSLSPLLLFSLLAVFLSVLLALNFKFSIFSFQSIFNLKFSISNYPPAILLASILIFAGAISNIIDRLRHGCVTDFIDLHVWPVFNLADVYITIGAIMIIYDLFKKDHSLN